MAILGHPRLPRKNFSHSCVIHSVIEYTKRDAPSLQHSKHLNKISLGIYCHFGELTGAWWRLPLVALPEAEILCLVRLLI